MSAATALSAFLREDIFFHRPRSVDQARCGLQIPLPRSGLVRSRGDLLLS